MVNKVINIHTKLYRLVDSSYTINSMAVRFGTRTHRIVLGFWHNKLNKWIKFNNSWKQLIS